MYSYLYFKDILELHGYIDVNDPVQFYYNHEHTFHKNND